MPLPTRTLAVALSCALVCACERTPADPAPDDNGPRADEGIYRDGTQDVGLVFHHVNGATGEFYFPEIMGSGCAVFDYDNDGDLDVYLVQGSTLGATESPTHSTPSNRLYRNELVSATGETSELVFVDVTDTAMVGDTGYGMGTAVGDYDNDGFLDLYVTNFGPNVLYHNNGNGTFTDVSAKAGVGDERWGTSATFADIDHDGYLDLFVTNYVEFSVGSNTVCRPTGTRDYCHPSNFAPETDVLYRNRGNGTFTDITKEAGIDRAFGSGLGVVAADLNEDGWVDIYVANDGNENQFWQNNHDGTFEDVALFSGVALSGDGAAEAGMGLAIDDFDLDGDPDIFVTHLRDETNTLYRNQGAGVFEDATFNSGLGYATLAATGFGVHWLDYDNDGLRDLFCANGAVAIANGPSETTSAYAEPNQLLRNVGDGFEDVTSQAGHGLSLLEVSRGAAFGDIDNDGDIDILVSNNGGSARLLLNEERSQHRWISLKLVGAGSNLFAVGAAVTLTRSDGTRAVQRVDAGGSYCSSSDLRLHFGLGPDGSAASIDIVWPSGRHERFASVDDLRLNELVEGTGEPL